MHQLHHRLGSRDPKRRGALNLLACAVVLACACVPISARAEKQVIKPGCTDTDYKLEAGSCVPQDALTSKANADEKVCTSHGGAFTKAPKDGQPLATSCTLPPQTPSCPGGSQISYDKSTNSCLVDNAALVADPLNYRGDCLQQISPIAGAPATTADERLLVLSQSADGKTIDVARASNGTIFGCNPIINEPRATIAVADVVSAGAGRSGWTYGMLVAPFKYYPHGRELVGSATVGPYIGWRMERLGGALTPVFSAGISSVSATAKADAPGATPATVPMMAWSLAGGVIFEVSKSKQPFRIGALFGADYAGKKDGVSYEHNGRPWLALQIGFDLTDR